jgi:hypothetical protein
MICFRKATHVLAHGHHEARANHVAATPLAACGKRPCCLKSVEVKPLHEILMMIETHI